MKLADERPTKKTYQTPKLIIHGTIREITKALGLKGAVDGGIFPANRTQL